MNNFERIYYKVPWIKSKAAAKAVCELLDEKDATIAALEARVTEMEERVADLETRFMTHTHSGGNE